MKTIVKRLLLLILLIPLLLFVVNGIHIGGRLYRLKHADHARILMACREAIANRNSYRNDRRQDEGLWPDEGVVLLRPPFQSEVPEAIRGLNPHDVIIRQDYVLVNLNLPFSRIGLLGFRPGAKQFGTEKYIDGLWFWNGDDYSAEETNSLPK